MAKRKKETQAVPRPARPKPLPETPFVRGPGKVYFRDIPQFTRHASYRVDVPWFFLEKHIEHAAEGIPGGFNMDPDYQRAHVWTEAQQVAYIEYILQGGMSGRDVYTNCRNWNRSVHEQGPFELVDGKQRLTAVLRFLRNEIPAFGHTIGSYGDDPNMMNARVSWWVNDLPTRADVLKWYLLLNSGGTQHTPEEIARVRLLLEQEMARVST